MDKKSLKYLFFIPLAALILILMSLPLNGCSKTNIENVLTKTQDQTRKTDRKNDDMESIESFKNDKNIENKEIDERSEEIMLPYPKLKSSISLEEALKNRRSVRQFSEKDLALEDISQILWAAQGITENSSGFRTAPSAGALYPIELFVVKSDGLFQYIAKGHKLKKLDSGDLRQKLMQASLLQESISNASLDIIITAVYERTTAKYGDRGIRYIYMEAGHVCQNILLQATALQLGAVPIGAFSDTEVQKVLGLSKDYNPLYIIPVGYVK